MIRSLQSRSGISERRNSFLTLWHKLNLFSPFLMDILDFEEILMREIHMDFPAPISIPFMNYALSLMLREDMPIPNPGKLSLMSLMASLSVCSLMTNHLMFA